MRPVRYLVPFMFLLLIPAVSIAAGPSSYPYWGIDLGATKITEGADAFSDAIEEESAALRLYGGYRANNWLGVEAGLHDLGRYDQADYRAYYHALVISGTLYIPVSRSFDLYGRVGGGVARLSERDDDFSATTRQPVGLAGLGMQIHVNPYLAFRGGVDMYAMQTRVRGPGGGDAERTSQRIGTAYLGLMGLF